MSPTGQHRPRFRGVGEHSLAEFMSYRSGNYSQLIKSPPRPEGRNQPHQDDKIILAKNTESPADDTPPASPASGTHPCTILQKGNSDPFSSQPIPIRAETNEILFFYGNTLLPLIEACIGSYSISVSTGKKKWYNPYSDLHTDCNAYGLLARTAVVMSRAAEPGSRIALHSYAHKKKTLKLLTARLKQQDERLLVQQAYPIVMSVLMGAVWEGALDEAAAHVKMLKFLLCTHSSRVGQEVDLGTLFPVLMFDFHRASKSLTRPIFNFAGWSADQMRPGWHQALAIFPEVLDQTKAGLGKAIHDVKLRSLILAIRQVLEIRALVTEDPSDLKMPTLMLAAYWMIICQGQLIDRYMDMADALVAESPAASFGQRWHSSTTAYLSLAALWWTRRLGMAERAPTTPFTTILNTNIIPALKIALIQSELISDGMDALINSRARLWALYVGAYAEQYASFTTRKPGVLPEDNWFNRELLLQARLMNIFAWSELREVVQNFLYSDNLEPHGSTWFTGT